jgi:hypothetical protein
MLWQLRPTVFPLSQAVVDARCPGALDILCKARSPKPLSGIPLSGIPFLNGATDVSSATANIALSFPFYLP